MKNTLKKAVLLAMTLLMMFSTVACLSGVSLAADTVTEIEPNDGSNTATLMPVDTLCNGSLSSEEESDWYKFTTQGDYFNIEFVVDSEIVNLNNVEEGWDITVYHSDSATPIREFVGMKESFVSANLAFDGTYYIKVSANADYNPYLAPIGCIYGLKIHTSINDKWESESNHSSDTANVITTDEIHHGSLYSGTDVDWYKFANDKDYFTLTFELNKNVNYSDVENGWNIYIYLSDGVTLVKEYEDVNEKLITPELPFSGEFLIKIVASNEYYMYAPIDCYYDFQVTTVNNSAWESELNDSSQNANSINTDNIYYGSLYKSEDIDWFVFDASTGAFNIELAPNSDVDTSKLADGWSVSVYPYGSSTPIYTNDGIISAFKSFDLPFKGKYTVAVKASNDYYMYAPTDCTYKLKVTTHNSSELWESETNNTAETATKVALNNTYNANFYCNEDSDYFTFAATSNGCCELTFKRDVSDSIGSGWTIKVVGSKSGEVFKGDMGVNSQSYAAKFAVKKGEKYTVCIDADSDYYSPVAVNYTIKVTIKSHTYKTTTTDATLTKNGKAVTKCNVCGNVSKTTTIYCPKTITLSTTSYTYNGKVKTPSETVKDSKGKTLKKNTDYTVKYESGRKVPGKYTVTVTFKGNYTGTKKLYFTIAPKVTSKITATQTTSTITLKWNKVTGADGYRVYKYNSKTKKYEKIKTTTGTSLKISKLKAGTVYKYKVRAYTKDDGTIWGAYSSVFETATKPKTPTLKVASTSKGKVTFSWTNVSGESGYQVYYSTKKSSGFKKVKSYKTNVAKGSKSKLKSGKKYYFKVRAYKKTASGTVYSSWSSVKSVKVK